MTISPTCELATVSTGQIGRCGELLVQYRLLKYGIESAPMTTDTGIDLVAYSPTEKRAVTIQVKANLQPKRSGGRGLPALDWWVAEASPAELVALVDLKLDDVWLFRHTELTQVAQQQSGGRLHFYFYTDLAARPQKTGRRAAEYEAFKIENRAQEIFFDLSAKRPARSCASRQA